MPAVPLLPGLGSPLPAPILSHAGHEQPGAPQARTWQSPAAARTGGGSPQGRNAQEITFGRNYPVPRGSAGCAHLANATKAMALAPANARVSKTQPSAAAQDVSAWVQQAQLALEL